MTKRTRKQQPPRTPPRPQFNLGAQLMLSQTIGNMLITTQSTAELIGVMVKDMSRPNIANAKRGALLLVQSLDLLDRIVARGGVITSTSQAEAVASAMGTALNSAVDASTSDGRETGTTTH